MCESIVPVSRVETNGRLEYRIWDSELKQADVMEGGYLLCWGTQGCAIFLDIFLPCFCLKILEQKFNFEKNSNA